MKTKIFITSLLLLVFAKDINGQGSIYRTGDVVTISATDSIRSQVFITGTTVEIFGWVGNDLVSASEFLTIDGNIMDDAMVAGANLTLRGTVHDLLAAAGENIIIDGLVKGDLFAAGANIRVTENAIIEGNANLAGQHIQFEGGTVEGNLKVAGSEMDLNVSVHKKTEIYSHDIEFGDDYNATLGTDIYTDITIYPENFGNIPGNLNIIEKKSDLMGILIFKSALYLSLFITGIVLIRVFKETSRDLYKFSTEQFWKNTGIGLATFLIYPMIVLVLGLLILTLPISFLLILIYGLLLLIGYLLVAMVLGVSILHVFKKNAPEVSYNWGLFIGMISLAIIVNLPYLGWLFHVAFIFFGLGSMVLYIWKMHSLPNIQAKADT